MRILHIPTGIIVTSVSRSQHQNREKAMQMLRARLFDLERQRSDSERAAARRGQVEAAIDPSASGPTISRRGG